MIGPSRLFWKLFLAFWLATTLTFFVGVALLTLGRNAPGDPRLPTVQSSVEGLVREAGLGAGLQLLALWQTDNDGRLGVYDEAGQLLGGAEVATPTQVQALVSADGWHVWFKSDLRRGAGPEGPPNHNVPLLVGTLMSALFSGYMAHYLVWPLVKLRRAMRRVAQGQFDGRVAPKMGRRRDEIVDLAKDCDRMAQQLKLLVEAQRQLLHDISHELRSPLTRMRAAIGLLRQEPDREEMLGRVERESERIDTLIDELLTLARLQGRPESIGRERVDVIELLAAITEDAQFEAQGKGCQVVLLASEPFVSRVSGELLYRCLENIIRNAVRYSPVGGQVSIIPHVSSTELVVRINDQGPGVEPHRLRSIFEPFERDLEAPLSGFGLGLAIASRAAQLHGGELTAHNLEGAGFGVTLRLPRG